MTAITKMKHKLSKEKLPWLGVFKKRARNKSHQIKDIRESIAVNQYNQKKNKLDIMAQKALQDYKQGKCRPL